jgi:hypothetical protein
MAAGEPEVFVCSAADPACLCGIGGFGVGRSSLQTRGVDLQQPEGAVLERVLLGELVEADVVSAELDAVRG